MLFPQPGKGVVEGSPEHRTFLPNVAHPVEAWGVIGTGIKAYDYMDGVHNRYGVHTVVLTVCLLYTSLALTGCSKETLDYNNPDVDLFVKQLKAGTYNTKNDKGIVEVQMCIRDRI